jgi:hypothetical protein
MIELNAASSSPNSAALSGPSIELRKRKVVPRASTLLADAKLNLTRADSAFGLCNAPVCRVESSARSKGSGIVDYLKLLKNNHFLEYRIAKKIRRSATFDRSHFRSTHPTFSKAAFAAKAAVSGLTGSEECFARGHGASGSQHRSRTAGGARQPFPHGGLSTWP